MFLLCSMISWLIRFRDINGKITASLSYVSNIFTGFEIFGSLMFICIVSFARTDLICFLVGMVSVLP